MSQKGTLALFLETARAEIGTVEGPRENETKYGAFMKANFQPWCGSFVNWVGSESKVEIPNTVYTPAGANAYKKAKAWQDAETATPQPGDIAYFDFPNDGIERVSHVGIVLTNNGDGTVTCVEGNTSSTKKGDQRNGGQVARRVRAYKKGTRKGLPLAVVGFGRPKFKAEKI